MSEPFKDDDNDRFEQDIEAAGRLHDRLWQLLDGIVVAGYSVEDACAMLSAVADGVVHMYPRIKRNE